MKPATETDAPETIGTRLLLPTEFRPDPAYRDDLVEFAVVIWRKRWAAALTGAAVLLLGIVATVLFPPLHEYSTAIEVAKIFDKKPEDLESIETVLAKLRDSFIPLVALQQSILDPGQGPIKVEATAPRKSRLVVLASKGAAEDSERHLQTHQEIVDALIADHHPSVARLRAELTSELSKASIRLEYLQSPSTLEVKKSQVLSKLRQAETQLAMVSDERILAATIKERDNRIQAAKLALERLEDQQGLFRSTHARLELKKQLLTEEIADLDNEVSQALAQRKVAASDLEDQSQAMTLLMIDNEIQQNRRRLADLEEELIISLESQREDLEASLKKNLRDQQEQKEVIQEHKAALRSLLAEIEFNATLERARIAEIQAELEDIEVSSNREIEQQERTVGELQAKLAFPQDTRALIPPMMTQKPIARSRLKILTITLALAIIAGLAGAFLADFLDKVRSRLRSDRSVVV